MRYTVTKSYLYAGQWVVYDHFTHSPHCRGLTYEAAQRLAEQLNAKAA